MGEGESESERADEMEREGQADRDGVREEGRERGRVWDAWGVWKVEEEAG